MAKRKTRGGLAPDKYLSDIQLKKLRQYVKDMADLARQRGSQRAITDELIIELLANTGLRASELVALNIEDLPVSHGKPSVWIRNGKGRVMVCEVMVCTPAIRATIRDDKIHQVYGLMQAGQKYGMQTMNQALFNACVKRDISSDEAMRRSSDPEELSNMLGEKVQSW